MRASRTAAAGRRSPDRAADRQPGRPSARPVVAPSAPANGPGAGTGHRSPSSWYSTSRSEPFDPRTREDFWDDLRRVHTEAGVTILVLTDDPVQALALADRLAVMDLGRIIQVGTPQELYNRPIDVFVARLLGPTNLLQGQVESHGADHKGEVVVRTPLGRLIGQMIPGSDAAGNAGHDLGPARDPVAGPDDPRRLEPVSGDRRADHVPGRSAPDPGTRTGRLADRRLGDPEPVAERAGRPEPHAIGRARARGRLAGEVRGRPRKTRSIRHTRSDATSPRDFRCERPLCRSALRFPDSSVPAEPGRNRTRGR